MSIWQVVRASDCNCYLVQFSGLTAPDGPTEEESAKALAEAEAAVKGATAEKTAQSTAKESSEPEGAEAAASQPYCSVWYSQIYNTHNQAKQACNQLVQQGFCQGCVPYY